MKRIVYLLAMCVPFISKAQDISLDRQIGIDVSFLSIGAFYEQPISKNILAEISAGIGSSATKSTGSFGYIYNDFHPYTRIELKRFYNRDNRIRKNKNISFNKGNYIGFQNKIFYGIETSEEDHIVMINELHWGVQAELEKRLLLNFHVGLGYATTKYRSYSGLVPTIGLKIKYALF